MGYNVKEATIAAEAADNIALILVKTKWDWYYGRQPYKLPELPQDADLFEYNYTSCVTVGIDERAQGKVAVIILESLQLNVQLNYTRAR